MNSMLLSIIVPCYNEVKNLPVLLERLTVVLAPYQYEIIFVNDGSSDATQHYLEPLALEREEIKFLSFSRNFGHQKAIKAGIDHAVGDCVITMDADLQHPPETIPIMLACWENGMEVVNTVRKPHAKLPFFKKWTSRAFYWGLSLIADHQVIANSSDFRLLDKKVVAVLQNMPEQNLYLRGVLAWVGYKQTTISYREANRLHGKPKFTLKKMIRLAKNGITSSSTKPLKIALTMGLFFAFLAFLYGSYAIVALFLGKTVPGWASIVASIVFLSGIQLIVLGVLGEYIGKMYLQAKNRPLYIVARTNIGRPQTTTLKQERRAAVF